MKALHGKEEKKKRILFNFIMPAITIGAIVLILAAQRIAGTQGIVFGAVDTDGTDGPGGLDLPGAPSCLAGAIVDGETVAEAKSAGMDLWQAMKAHATSAPLWTLGCGVEAEHCVSALDLRIILIT